MKWVIGTWIVLTVLLALAFHARAEEKPTQKPAPVTVSESAQNKVLKAQLALKDAQAEMASLETRWQTIQNQAKDLQSQAPAITQKINAAQEALQKEINAAAKDIGLDLAKYDFDKDRLVFSPKAEPAKPGPSPEKK
jgi:peptidoglycan hydrolase CwlO-like protein